MTSGFVARTRLVVGGALVSLVLGAGIPVAVRAATTTTTTTAGT